jgi:hypothetical protein
MSIVLALGITGCSPGNHSRSFLAAIQQTQASYRVTAGAEYPGMMSALQTQGGNATAAMSLLGAMMQKNYKADVDASVRNLGEASRHFQELATRHGLPDDLKADFQEYSGIIQRNRTFFTTTDPLSQLERWFNDYSETDSLYQRIVDGISRLGAQ